MTTAFRLLIKTLTLRTPPRALAYGLMNKVHYLRRTGNRRYEFERLYLDKPDPWDYASSEYEHEKYDRALACLLKWRRASDSALEIGCSIGVFTKMLAHRFGQVVAIDVSKEALAAAKERNRHEQNINFVHANLLRLNLGMRFNVISCAEVLYYIREKDAEAACMTLDQHLADDGIVVFVSGSSLSTDLFYFDGWEEILSSRYHKLFREVVETAVRPYRIAVFSRKA